MPQTPNASGSLVTNSRRYFASAASDKLSDAELWQAHQLLKQRLVAFIRDRVFETRLARGESDEYIETARTMFDPSALTIGFARRIAGYKRWDLLLSEPDRLPRSLTTLQNRSSLSLPGKHIRTITAPNSCYRN